MAARFTLAGLVYKVAGWRDWVNVIANYLFAIIHRFKLTKEQVVEWLQRFVPSLKEGAVPAELIPDDLVKMMAEAMASINIPSGKFIQALIQRLDDPPPGFRWKVDDLGNHQLVKQVGRPSKEKPPTRGARFRDKAFVGVWWYTDDAKSRNHVRLRSEIRKQGGSIFHKVKSDVGVTEYWGYAIVPSSEARFVGGDLLSFLEALKEEEGDRDFRLSAIDLSSLGNNEPVKASDVITAAGIFPSVKFNWEYNLPDVINGRLKDSKANAAVKQLLLNYGK